MSEKQYAMRCPHCGCGLRVLSRHLGTRRDCPKCHEAIDIGQPRERRSASHREEIPIVCKVCGTRFHAESHRVGSPVDCPDCLTEHIVPQPDQPAPERKVPVSDGDETGYRLQPLDHPADGIPNPPSFHTACHLCGTVLSATHDQIGTTIQCPDCESPVLVAAPPPKPEPRVVPQDPRIGIDPPVDLSRTRQQMNRLLDEAREHVQMQEKKKAKPIKRPFVDDVFFYFRYRTVAYASLVISALIFFIRSLVFVALRQQGIAMVSAIPMMMVAAVLSGVFLLACGYILPHILHHSALGFNNPDEDWPAFEMAESFGGSMYVFGALLFTMLPAMLSRVVLPLPIVYSLAGLSLFLFYPFVLLSMQDAGSAAVPFSPHIYRTVHSGRSSWFKFYAVSSVTIALAGVGILAQVFVPTVGGILSAGLIAVGIITYFRLLGRLAYALDRLPVPGDKSLQQKPV